MARLMGRDWSGGVGYGKMQGHPTVAEKNKKAEYFLNGEN